MVYGKERKEERYEKRENIQGKKSFIEICNMAFGMTEFPLKNYDRSKQLFTKKTANTDSIIGPQSWDFRTHLV